MFKQVFDTIILGRGQENGGGPSLDLIIESADAHLNHLHTLIRPLPESKPRTSFNSDVPAKEATMLNLTPAQKLRVAKRMVPLMLNMNAGAHMYDHQFVPQQDEATPEFIAAFEKLARSLGAKDIGYVKVPRNAIFQGKGIPCEYAIVFTVEMEQEPIETAPSLDCQLEVMDGYKEMAIISKKLSQHLRKHGYAAYPGTALGGVTDYPHLAELAGLGAIGYHGLLIAPGEGARLRINTIYTNITNLPTLEATGQENEHLWVRDFCAMCKKCVRKCPVSAIYDEPEPRGDGGMQTIDHKTCRDY
ncbi:MAG: hypothetical protein KDE19_12080, partial [Caldilineaceae bacterium]|nr:hypothetical protein [Caldilineaceae bacterium]